MVTQWNKLLFTVQLIRETLNYKEIDSSCQPLLLLVLNSQLLNPVCFKFEKNYNCFPLV